MKVLVSAFALKKRPVTINICLIKLPDMSLEGFSLFNFECKSYIFVQWSLASGGKTPEVRII